MTARWVAVQRGCWAGRGGLRRRAYFADVGTVDTSPDVDTREGDGVVYRVAR